MQSQKNDDMASHYAAWRSAVFVAPASRGAGQAEWIAHVHPCSPLAKLCWFCSLQGLGPVVVVRGWAGERVSGSGGRVDARGWDGWDGWDGWGARSKQARHLQVVVIGACVCVCMAITMRARGAGC
jgi:hypothetical protein